MIEAAVCITIGCGRGRLQDYDDATRKYPHCVPDASFLEKIASLLEEKRQVIFQRPPGTGNVCSESARRIALTVFSALPLEGFFFALIVLSSLITMSWTYLLFSLPNLSNLC